MVHPTAEANLLVDYYDRLPAAIAACVDDVAPVTEPDRFSPGFQLPELTDEVRAFLSVATARWWPVGEYSGHRLSLLDLTANPGTGTTKTFASLLIVARAVEYVRRTGERVTIFSPTSANKGVALRDAVLRAYDAGLATPEQLRIVVVAPEGCRQKFRDSRLSADPALRAVNPVLFYDGPDAEGVKALGREFVTKYAAAMRAERDTNLWFSLELRNYLVADTVRAFFERAADPIEDATRPRLHAHAVSSAFGLLGYHQGRSILEAAGEADPKARPASLLVQHLGTPDMVLNLRHGDFDRSAMPAYRLDETTALYRQDADPRFPQVTHDPAEVLDPTFYTHRPVTSAAMNDIIGRHGGDGIVVSRAECLERYPALVQRLRDTGPALPADPQALREWSLVMAFTGVCNAIDRGLVEADRDIVVHGSGTYTTADYRPINPAATRSVSTLDDVAAAVLP